MKKSYLFWSAVLMFILACSLTNGPMTPAPQVATITPISIPSSTPFLPQTATVIPPTVTASPTTTPSATPTPGFPTLTITTSANCRQGPGTEYPIWTGILEGQSVRILGISTPERPTWWLVEKDGIRCWVSGILGVTSGNMVGIPVVLAPPVPTPTKNTIDVLFENNTVSYICRMVFYDGIDVVATYKWNKGEFDNDGSDKILALPVGGYDLIEVYGCDSNLVVTLTNIVINQDNHAFPLPPVP